MTQQQDSNPDPVGSVSKRDYLRLLLAALGVGAISTGSVETAKAAHLSDSPYPSGAWGYAPIASHGVSDRPSIAELNEAWSKTYHFLNQDVDVGARYYAEKNDSKWDLLPIVWDSLNTPSDTELPAGGMKIEDDGSQFRLVNLNAAGDAKNVSTLAYTTTSITPTRVTWTTAADWDAAQSESGVHHEQPSNTDWAASDVIEKGYPSTAFEGIDTWGYWPFNEDSGTTGYDISGNNRDVGLGGATPNASGLHGRSAISLDGTDDQPNADGPDDSFTNGVAVGGWFYWDGNNGKASSFTLGGGGNSSFRFNHFNEFGSFKTEYKDSTGTIHTVTYGNPPTETWTLHVVTIDASGNFDCYAKYGNTTDTGSTTGVSFGGVNDADTRIGHNFGNEFDGDISDAFVLDGAVTSTQVNNIYEYFVGDSDYWTSKKTETGITSTITLTTTTTIPNNTTVDITVFEDVGNDDTGSGTDALGNNYDNSATVNLTGGTGETNDLTGFDGGGSTNAYWLHFEIDITNNDPTTPTSTVSEVSVDV